MNVEQGDEPSSYKIGAVSRLTGISPDTLRIWERRYAAITPERTTAGDRLFSDDDIARLRLIKLLVDQGDSIGSVASLPLQALKSRVNQASAASAGHHIAQRSVPVRIIVVGEALSAGIETLAVTLDTVDLVARYSDIPQFETSMGAETADVVVIDQPTLHMKHVSEITNWLLRSSIPHAVIVYRYANDKVLRQLPASRCSVLRAPVEAPTVIDHCASVVGGIAMPHSPESATDPDYTSFAPPRRFDDKSLAQLARISTAVQCECPRHLAELITSLTAFEQYSFECESASPRDAALHAHLNKTASHARHMIEDALEMVIEAEGLHL